MKLMTTGLCSLSLLLAACGETPAETGPVEPSPTAEETLAQASAAAVGPFAPKDDCADLYGFDSFRGQLRRAVTFQDANSLAALADPAIKLDFGGGSGIDTLKTKLAEDPELWSELGNALALGCASDSETSASMPWIFSNLPEGADGFSTYLVTANDTPLLASASADAASDRKLGWELVERIGDAPTGEAEFLQVKTLDEPAEGYVAADHLRLANGYRLLANRGDNGWKLTAFVAGD